MIARLLRNPFTYAILGVMLATVAALLKANHFISTEWAAVLLLWAVTGVLFGTTLAACDNPNPAITQTHVSWLYAATLFFMVGSALFTVIQTAWSIHYAMQVS